MYSMDHLLYFLEEDKISLLKKEQNPLPKWNLKFYASNCNTYHEIDILSWIKRTKILYTHQKEISIFFSPSSVQTWDILVTIQKSFLQVNLFQKHLSLPQLTHNMTKDCSVQENSKLITCWVHKLFWISKQKPKNNLCTQHVLSLEFPCTELVIQWTICCHNVV